MDPKFSEFSYGFALSYEIVNAVRPKWTGVPLFPSLTQEEQLGFDVSFAPVGWPLFLQFKLAHYMKSRRAKYWSDFNAPFYQVALHRRQYSNQHNTLLKLSQTESEVYYAAPAFHLKDEFDNAFVSDRILMRSVFISLRELPNIYDNDLHHITFQRNTPTFYWHSNHGKPFNVSISGRDWITHVRNLDRAPVLGDRYFIELRNKLTGLINDSAQNRGVFGRRLPVDVNNLAPRAVLRDLQYLLVAQLGVELIILRPTGG